MNTIKFLKNDYIQINKQIYKPYTICDLPNNFGCLTFQGDKEGISEWFNYAGYTYIFHKMSKK